RGTCGWITSLKALRRRLARRHCHKALLSFAPRSNDRSAVHRSSIFLLLIAPGLARTSGFSSVFFDRCSHRRLSARSPDVSSYLVAHGSLCHGAGVFAEAMVCLAGAG